MSKFPCFDSEISAAGLKFSIHTELVPSGDMFKINTFVSSSDGTAFSFNSRHEENFSEEDIRSRHELIVGKITSIFSQEMESSNKNNVDFAAMYTKKDFRPGFATGKKISENIKKTIIFEDK
jgi:hypothetical protein